MINYETRLPHPEIAATVAHAEKLRREHSTFDTILASLDFSVETAIPSPESIEKLEKLDMFLYDKVPLLLAALGEKPASMVCLASTTWKKHEEPKEVSDKQTDDIVSTAQALGLQTHVMDHVVDLWDEDKWKIRYITVSLSSDNLTILDCVTRPSTVSDELILGKLLGFPDSAIAAFASQENLVPYDSHPYINDEQRAFGSFRMSQDNVTSELLTVDRWARAVKHSSPFLYDQVSKV